MASFLRVAPGLTLRSLEVFITWTNLKVLDLGGTGGDRQKVRQALPPSPSWSSAAALRRI